MLSRWKRAWQLPTSLTCCSSPGGHGCSAHEYPTTRTLDNSIGLISELFVINLLSATGSNRVLVLLLKWRNLKIQIRQLEEDADSNGPAYIVHCSWLVGQLVIPSFRHSGTQRIIAAVLQPTAIGHHGQSSSSFIDN